MKPPSTPTAVVLIGHGSRNPNGTQQFLDLTAQLQTLHPDCAYYPAFMELAEPSIDAAIHQACLDGHSQILCQPALLLTAGHAKNDLPAMIRHAALHHPHATLHYGQPIGLTAELVRHCATQLAHLPSISPASSTLLVVGRGTSDPDTNSNVAKLARLLQEACGFAEADIAFFAATTPLLAQGIQRSACRCDQSLVVFPFILFDGFLNSVVDSELALIQTQFPHLSCLRMPPLAAHPDFAKVILESILKGLDPSNDLPCLLCKYRSVIPNFEHDHLLPQPNDHHHHHHHHTPSASCSHSH